MVTKKKSLLTTFLRYCIPTVLSLWVFTMYSLVDGMFVARGVGELALSAVNMATPYMQVLFSLGILFGVGTSTVVSILRGQDQLEKANKVFTQNTVFLFGVGILITALMYIFIDPFVRFLGAEGETAVLVKEYIYGILPFSLSFVVAYSLEILVKADGHPKVAMISVTTGAILNCILDYLFIMVLQWGIWGAAFATGISQSVVLVLFMAHFLKKRGNFRFCRFEVDVKIYKRIIPIGIPDGLTELSAGAVRFFFNTTLLRYIGVHAIASYSILAYVGNVVVMTMAGISQGVQPLVSYYYGRGDTATYKKLWRYALVSVAIISLVAFAATMVFAEQIVSVFIVDMASASAVYSVAVLRVYAISFLFAGYNVLSASFLTAVEKASYAITISFSRGLVLIAASLAVLPVLFGAEAIWWASTAAEAICLVLTIVFMRLFFKKGALPEVIEKKAVKEAAFSAKERKVPKEKKERAAAAKRTESITET
ncbi:MATE family efflux transporter [Christensenellaceae bacterium OttesenSCG-928-M15]|nr:MATE family efflux transporter [Christensenellaceae bacterium OttesenSCG-928-M15]